MPERASKSPTAHITVDSKSISGIGYPNIYSGEAVRLEWGWNKAAKEAQLVKITIGGKSSIVHTQELYQILRNT